MSNIEEVTVGYKHFSHLLERFAVYIERLENLSKKFDKHETDYKEDINSLRTRLQKIEDSDAMRRGSLFSTRTILEIIGFCATLYLYYHMVNWK